MKYSIRMFPGLSLVLNLHEGVPFFHDRPLEGRDYETDEMDESCRKAS